MQTSTTPTGTSGSEAPTDVSFQPVFLRSAWDIAPMPWASQPTPILALAPIEGTDYPFFTRASVDDAWPWEAYRRRDVRAHLHLQALGVALSILEPPDETILALGQEVYEGPSVATLRMRRRARQQITGTWATEYNASRFAFLPATSYADDTCRLFSEIQRHFLENTIDEGLTWSLWSLAEVTRLYNLRLSRFLLETELIRERRQITVNDAQATYSLPSDAISVCRVSLDNQVLTRVDEWQMDNGVVGWETTQGTPYGYIEEGDAGSLTITLVPTPDANTTLEVIVVVIPDASTQQRCTPVPIPAVFSPYIKWGVIADLLSKEGEANDPIRAAYAESRFSEGVELGRLYTAGGKR